MKLTADSAYRKSGVSRGSLSRRAAGSVLCLALLAAAGCGPATEDGEVDLNAQFLHFMGALYGKETKAQTGPATRPAAVPSNLSAEEEVVLTAAELEMWQDPSFQKKFIESYAAESDIEPVVNDVEKEDLREVLRLMAVNDETDANVARKARDEAAGLLTGLRGDKANPIFDYLLGNIYFQRDQLGPAAEAFEAAVAKKSNYRRALLNLGLTYARQKKVGKCIKPLTKVIELGGGNDLCYGLLGYAYASKDDFLAAESAYRMAVLMDPNRVDYKVGLADSLLKQQRYEDTISMTNLLLAKDPERAEMWKLQAFAYLGQEKTTKAAESLEIVDRLGHSTEQTLYTLAGIYVNEGIYDMASRRYVQALERQKNDPNASVDIAINGADVMARGKAYKEAKELIAYLEENRKLDKPEKMRVLKLRARIALAQGAGAEEAKVLEEIVALDPLDGDAMIQLGRYYSRQTHDDLSPNEGYDVDKAVSNFARAAKLDKYEAEAKFLHGRLLADTGKFDQALPLLRRVQQLQPGNTDLNKYITYVQHRAKSK